MSSPPSAARPRRSHASTPVSYTQFMVPPVSPSGSSSNEDGEEGNNNKKSKKRAPASDADETTVSEYEEEEKEEQGKGKGKGKAQSSEDEDEVMGGDDSPSSSGSGEDEPDASDDSNAPPPVAGRRIKIQRVGKKDPKEKKAPKMSKARESRPAPRLVSKRTTAEFVFTRCRTPIVPPQPSAFIPSFEPPARGLGAEGESMGEASFVGGEPASESVRAGVSEMWITFPWGPERSLVQDMGWSKGKWDVKGKVMRARWGGWYPEIKEQSVEEVDPTPYLPRPLYPSVPGKIVYVHPEVPAEAGEDVDMDDDPAPVPGEDENGPLKVWVGNLDGDSEQTLIGLATFESKRLDEHLPTKPGHFLNAGGPVSGLAWAPHSDSYTSQFEYLAIATMSSSPSLHHSPHPMPSLIQIWALDTSVPSDLQRCTTETHGSGMSLHLGICIDVGEAWDLKWCPLGGSEKGEDGMEVEEEEGRLGLLAGAFTDGSISFFVVPNPEALRAEQKTEEGETLYVHLKPVLRLVLENTSFLSFDWNSHESIVAGCSNGSVAVYFVGDALRKGLATVRPTQYFPLHTSSIRSLVVITVPPLSRAFDAEADLEAESNLIATTGYEGTSYIVDLRDPGAPYLLSHERCAGMVMAYSPYNSIILNNDQDNRVGATQISPRDFGMTRKLSFQRGALWSIATSNHHPFIVSTSADGTCLMSGALRSIKKKAGHVHVVQNVFRLDFSRKTGEYRMVDNQNPETRSTIEIVQRRKAVDAVDDTASTAAWSPNVSISRSNWHPNLQRACLLATGTVSGLVRIDWIERTWSKPLRKQASETSLFSHP